MAVPIGGRHYNAAHFLYSPSCRERKFSETYIQPRAFLCVRIGAVRPFAPVEYPRSRHFDTPLDRYAAPRGKASKLYIASLMCTHVSRTPTQQASEVADPLTARLGVRPPAPRLDYLIGSTAERAESPCPARRGIFARQRRSGGLWSGL
jgi:hypothetical protein